MSTADCADTTDATSTTTTTDHTYDSADRITDSGYVYDAFGRTATQPDGSTITYYDGSTITYYTDDLVQQETTGTTRQTWTLDAAHRLADATVQTLGNGTWANDGLRGTAMP